MAKNVEFVPNTQGIRELLRSNEMMAICKRSADEALATLGDGYEVTTLVGVNRVNAEVAAVTYQARKENSENNTILKSLRRF